jgi:hypothetical protein
MYMIPDAVRSTASQDGAIILDIRQGRIFNLNLVGSRIFDLVATGHTELQIVDEISREFVVSRDIAELDVREFLQTLMAHQLIEQYRAESKA